MQGINISLPKLHAMPKTSLRVTFFEALNHSR